ncbi:hypothetical protein [Thalassolituus marinus]|uniref:DUF1049 domain-containing protein n=1 Tax=Thalassolituus marinus TaxID=671053 RepID=A0ABS7ZUN6_9GAMM|nr:hypothetical protein [Thalassolituus marinus]MCA6064275.1 hypothetical protein [Thalassolituus marinus]
MSANIRHWLRQRANMPQQNFRLFVMGAFVFFLGVATIILSNKMMLPSLRQELMVMLGLVVAVVGGAAATLGYLALSLLRLFTLFDKKDD